MDLATGYLFRINLDTSGTAVLASDTSIGDFVTPVIFADFPIASCSFSTTSNLLFLLTGERAATEKGVNGYSPDFTLYFDYCSSPNNLNKVWLSELY